MLRVGITITILETDVQDFFIFWAIKPVAQWADWALKDSYTLGYEA